MHTYGELADLVTLVIRGRNDREIDSHTNGFRQVTELGYDDLTYKVRSHFAANDDLDFFEEEVMSLGKNILQSPIERVSFAFLKQQTYDLGIQRSKVFTVLPADPLPDEVSDCTGVAICPQHQVDGYFLDFAVFINTGRVKLAFDFECDGHDFHGANNHQASHDWARDIAISCNGFQIYRVAGKQINRHPLWAIEQFGLEVENQIRQLHLSN